MYYSNLTLDNSLHQTAPNIHMLGGEKANKTKKKTQNITHFIGREIVFIQTGIQWGQSTA